MTQSRRNIEIKGRCADLDAARARAAELGAQDMGVFHQRDTFFRAPHARLKLRDLGDGRGEIISYRRRNAAEARASDYHVCPVEQPARLVEALEYALGSGGVVTKRRHLFLYRHTRIHLDEVEGLGTFLELETIVSEQSDREAEAELVATAAALGLKLEDSVPAPYVELLGIAPT